MKNERWSVTTDSNQTRILRMKRATQCIRNMYAVFCDCVCMLFRFHHMEKCQWWNALRTCTRSAAMNEGKLPSNPNQTIQDGNWLLARTMPQSIRNGIVNTSANYTYMVWHHFERYVFKNKAMQCKAIFASIGPSSQPTLKFCVAFCCCLSIPTESHATSIQPIHCQWIISSALAVCTMYSTWYVIIIIVHNVAIKIR